MRTLTSTFAPELLSMNLLMAGMVPTVMVHIKFASDPTRPEFVMSMGLLIAFVVAYPINWWLVANHLKHGMMTYARRARMITPFQPSQAYLRFRGHGHRYR
jgi:hypothetical protein